MDFCRNVTVPVDYSHQQEQLLASPPPCSKFGAALTATTSPLDDLFSAQNTEVDVRMEWLSMFVEDCLSSTGNCLPLPNTNLVQSTDTTPKPSQQNPPSLEKFIIPGKARSKRKRVKSAKARNPLSSWSYGNNQTVNFPSSDPPLLQQTYWLADSELIIPRNEDSEVQGGTRKVGMDVEKDEEKATIVSRGSKDNSGTLENNNGQQPRRCTHCLTQKTPQWRAGPLGPKTLCNACGVRYKSGRLLPEYRPAKSPTFVSYLHSNSHKKVMEMRMGNSSSVFHS
ncbi:hypothetical protein K2173_025501 [Erythroxylum novogranatense]|uniref:GATA-type domain-containing protein n=1 Tax=Erythroxylum novogranatense TaxID=1862640 RepID=A0AAV8T8I5_9ROSI|nr:hypothetical protein K2173_025501 [Erythroxylum novogranatense]